MRHGRMRALPRNNNPEIVAGRHNGAGAHAELALLHARPVMHAKDGVHGEARKQAVVYHPFGADVPFLGWLEYNVHHAIEVAMLRQVTRRSQQHGGMAIMATGMHFPSMLTGLFEGVHFLHGQGIHIGAPAYGTPTLADRKSVV